MIALLAAGLSANDVLAQRLPDAHSPDALAAIRAAHCGLVPVAALDLPEPFLKHIVEWEIRNAWRRAYHQVQSPPAAPPPPGANSSDAAATGAQGPQPAMAGSVTVLDADSLRLEASAMDVWMEYLFDVPELRGFRAPLGAIAVDPWPFKLLERETDDGQSQRYRDAATFVSANLARDGLIRTVMRLMKDVKPPSGDLPGAWVAADGTLKLNRLRAVGVPVVLLAMFTIDGQPATAFLAKWVTDGMPGDVQAIAARAAFNFVPSCPGFAAMAEDGSANVGSMRFQLPTNRFRDGVGDGSVLDVFRQLALRDASMPIIVSIHGDGIGRLLDEMQRWTIPQPGRIVIAPQPANLTQWAQDNCRTGRAPGAREGSWRTVVLAPRYASRTELRSVCVPSDSLVMETLRRGFGGSLEIVQSPLLFQGGNAMVVVDPKTGRRTLLLGEAELHRNGALGLTDAQVRSAFTTEFGVHACEIMPAASLHIDLDFSIRRVNQDLVACVADDVSAARLVAIEGARSLGRNGVIPTADVDAMCRALAGDGPGTASAAAALNRAVDSLRDKNGVITAQLPAMFAPGAAGVDFSRRWLAAVDVVMANATTDAQLAGMSLPQDYRSYMQSLRATHAQLDAQAATLQRLGMRTVRIPAMSDREVSVNPINGLHIGSVYLMPACGGPCESVDRAAREAFERAFGPDVQIQLINTSAVQTTDGGLHCMISTLPR